MENDLYCPSLDDLDRSIIELMKVNGRITYKEVSDIPSLSKHTTPEEQRDTASKLIRRVIGAHQF